MENVKNFEDFINEGNASPSPAEPTVKPGIKEKPSTRPAPQKPGIVRKDKPSVDPGPKAEKPKEMEKATLKDIVTRVKKVADIDLVNTLKNKY